MKSKKILPAVIALVLILFFSFAMTIYALNGLGIDILKIQTVSIGSIKTIMIKFIFFILAATIVQVLSFLIAKSLRSKIMKFLDARLLPRKGKAETHQLIIGERLEIVAKPSYLATTFWEMLIQIFLGTFLLSIFSSGLVMFVTKSKYPWNIILGMLVLILINLLIITIFFWIKEWRREHTKFVVFTTRTYYVKARMPLFALLFGSGTLPSVSQTPMNEMTENQIAADPEDFDIENKTSFIKDQYLAYLAKKINTRTLFLRSKSKKAEDILVYIDNGVRLAKILDTLVADYPDFEKENRPYKPDTSIKPIDLFRVEDPGLYDYEGNLVENT
ncbi:hypothetical protein A2V49_03795 [candidate division WWE3 bacterium RBG_19FT_COMBO_34_6]|uniref:Uncharacterized protein n=1 Tax=candidate division WWE3 bacterium RBG_19FT_COMBO_34_6 TaxID=1802612 RepID=A0A1F4UKU8_UNCKA|nr:MAG: hypothetical protein A2V49_03795 [candidate division WWE3 bacterium RBG_19FT_COMBO_34_6]